MLAKRVFKSDERSKKIVVLYNILIDLNNREISNEKVRVNTPDKKNCIRYREDAD
jgi:hypothetical protein